MTVLVVDQKHSIRLSLGSCLMAPFKTLGVDSTCFTVSPMGRPGAIAILKMGPTNILDQFRISRMRPGRRSSSVVI